MQPLRVKAMIKNFEEITLNQKASMSCSSGVLFLVFIGLVHIYLYMAEGHGLKATQEQWGVLIKLKKFCFSNIINVSIETCEITYS